MPLRLVILCWLLIAIISQSAGQKAVNSFRHLTPDDGLSNESVRGIAQDQYGFIWLGTQFGLNRFDGIHIKSWFYDPNDSTTIPNNFVRSMYGDNRGRVWIGGDPGFCQYDYSSNSFIRYGNSNYNMIDIDGDKYGNIWVATHAGLKRVDTINHVLVDIKYTKDSILSKIFDNAIRDVHCGVDGRIYMATNAGVIIYDPASHTATRIHKDLPGQPIHSNDVTAVAADTENRIWAAMQYNNGVLVRLSADWNKKTVYDEFRHDGKRFTPNTINRIFVDKKGRIWVGSNFWGLAKYDPSIDHFIRFTHDPALPNSISCNQALCFLNDRSGLLWTGSEGYGVNYFNPDHDIFSPVQRNPHLSKTLPDNWTRAFTEDAKGRLGVATAKGVSALDNSNAVIETLDNSDSSNKKLHSSSVRSLLTDRDGTIWIGTAQGVNRFHPSTGKMDFYGIPDSISQGFTWFLYQLRNGKVLAGNNHGLFEYLPATNNFYYYGKNAELKKYNMSLRSFTEASNGYWWIGTFAAGVIVYDPVNDKVVRVIERDSTKAGLSSNFIQDIKEDKDGNMWLSTRFKLNRYNQSTNTNTIYGLEDGLPSNWIGGILFDSLGRTWVSTGKGLCVLNKAGKVIKVFGLRDGLFSSQFTDQPAYVAADGRFLFAGLKGFLSVKPSAFNWKDTMPVVYITSFKVLNKEWNNPVNLEEIRSIRLRPDENFFSAELIGLQYEDPNNIWYGYMLEGFDKEWIYTKERIVNYTNVPGGDYTFRFKATNDPNNWNVEEKTLAIHIATVFYKTWWFRALAIGLLVAIVFSVYRYRNHQKEKMLRLQSKAQLLEKEKALVMFGNLKQQLNPHFLFNSLTSLSGLIETNQRQAGDFLNRMSRIYRYILKNSDQELVTLQEEIEFVKVYIDLQRTRFKEGLHVNIRTSAEDAGKKIAPVTLQNLVENAIKHNIIDEESPLVIEIYTEKGYVVVRNNLQKKNVVETSNKQGLAKLKSLYQYLSNNPVLTKEDTRYFTISIPLI